MSGKFIVFEGSEACGKSTQIQLLSTWFQGMGKTVRVLREPGGTPLGEKIRHLLKHDPDGVGMCPLSEVLLFNASRAELVRKVIKPALDAGEIVICDRFYHSTLAYQCFGRGLDMGLLKTIIGQAVKGVEPDIVVLLEVSKDETQRRLSSRGAESGTPFDRFDEESSDFFDRVNAGYRTLTMAYPAMKVVRGEGHPHEVHSRVTHAIMGMRSHPVELCRPGSQLWA